MEQGEVTPRHHVTRLIIERDYERPASLSDVNRFFSIKNLTLGRANFEGSVNFYRLSNLSGTTSLEIVMRKDNKLENVSLPDNILNNIAKYLRERPQDNGDFHCRDFVHYVNDVPYNSNRFDAGRWDISKMTDERNLQHGDTIVLGKSIFPGLKKNTHFGIYLGNELYLSKFGNTGPLIVTTLDEMKKGFGGDYVLQFKPTKNKFRNIRSYFK